MNQVTKSMFLGTVIMLLLSSCAGNHPQATPAEMMRFVENQKNGLASTVSGDDIQYNIQFKPIDYIICKEQPVLDRSAYTQRKQQLYHTVWFNISLKAKGSNINPLKWNVSGIEEYNARLTYFLEKAGNNIELLYGSNKMPQIAYHFENNYGLSPSDVMVVGFKIPDDIPQQDMVIIYDDQLFLNRNIRRAISASDLTNIPTISI